MKAVEAVKEKFYCFLGIVHPTYYQSRGWGPWLDQYALSSKIGFCQENALFDSDFYSDKPDFIQTSE